MEYLLIYAVIINALTFCVYGFDKWMARVRAWRISELTLILLALIGGSAGALVGMHVFRHKTRKAAFQFMLALVLFVQAAALCAIALLKGWIVL